MLYHTNLWYFLALPLQLSNTTNFTRFLERRAKISLQDLSWGRPIFSRSIGEPAFATDARAPIQCIVRLDTEEMRLNLVKELNQPVRDLCSFGTDGMIVAQQDGTVFRVMLVPQEDTAEDAGNAAGTYLTNNPAFSNPFTSLPNHPLLLTVTPSL